MSKSITFRIPDELEEMYAKAITDKKQKATEFFLCAMKGYVNPTTIEVEKIVEVDKIIYQDREVEKIVEVEKEVVREVVKEIFMDREGTVIDGVLVKLSFPLVKELEAIKVNPESPLEAFVSDICWSRLKFEKNKKIIYSKPQQSAFNGNPANRISKDEITQYPPPERPFDYWNKRIADCDEYDYPEQEKIVEGVKSETGITEPQRKLLQRGGTLRKS
jgi:hypothetical protein